MLKKAKIAIVGAGVAGSSTALQLGQLGLNVTLFEKEVSLVSGFVTFMQEETSTVKSLTNSV